MAPCHSCGMCRSELNSRDVAQQFQPRKNVWICKGRGVSELTNLLCILASKAISFIPENIPCSNTRLEWSSEVDGKKLSKNSCGGIRPTKNDAISLDSHPKIMSLSSYFGENLSVVELQVCTGVPAGSIAVHWGGVQLIV